MHNPDLDQERREECRGAVREFLAARQAVSFHAKDILRGLNAGREHDFTLDEIEAALVFLVDLGDARILRHRDGATKFHQATSQGVLYAERGE